MTTRGKELGELFANSLANKDRETLVSLLADDIDFRAMTPGRFWESGSPTEIVDDVILGRWFDPNDHIESLVELESSEVIDRSRVGYRVRVRNGDGVHLVEQQAYFTETEGRISWLRIMCSGYRPLAE
jgi:hypothetical protein